MARKDITPDKLYVGMYVVLDLSWWKHPFIRNSFKIESKDQIETIQSLGLEKLEYDPERSDPPREKPAVQTTVRPQPAAPQGPGEYELLIKQVKQKKLEYLAKKQERLKQCDRKYQQSLTQVAELTTEVTNGKEEGIERARTLVGGMVETLQGDAETMVHLLNLKDRDRQAYFHSLNVSILSLITGREMGMEEDQLRSLGTGALMHDVGKLRIPKKVLFKKPPLSKAEQDYIRMHPQYGFDMTFGIANVTPPILDIILQHHERISGKGYPQGLTGDRINIFAAITAVADIYDNLCNSRIDDRKYTPHEAVSLMYNNYRREIRTDILACFIRGIGVYPPGTLVELSDGNRGMVIAMGKETRVKPTVLVYAEKEPVDGPILLDLAEEGLKVEQTLVPEDLTPEEFDYFSPERSMGFYIHQKS